MVDEITRVVLGARMSQADRIRKSVLNSEEVLSSDEEVKKAEEAMEKIVEEEEAEGTEKSDIANALSDYGNAVKITKTGKEIKAQISDVLIPELTAALAKKETEATTLLASCGTAPTRDPDRWWTDGIKIDCGYKIYDWNETQCCSNSDGRLTPATLSAQDAADKRGNIPEDAAQAEARQNYNDAVRAICNIKVDLKTCEVMSSLKDNTEFQLNPRQILALKF